MSFLFQNQMRYQLLCGDALEQLRLLPSNYVRCCVTSPPYYRLRDYKVAGQIGLEDTPEAYIARLVDVLREVRRVLTDDGTLWINIADKWATRKQGTVKVKDMIGIPWMLAFALRADGWYLRQEIIWHKTNPMPESVSDRCTNAHESIFLLSKSPFYHFDRLAIQEKGSDDGKSSRLQYTFRRKRSKEMSSGPIPDQGSTQHRSDRKEVHYGEVRNKRSVWRTAAGKSYSKHLAAFPPKLITPCILAGSTLGDYVIDPFAGSGTTGCEALRHGRKFVGIELNPGYINDIMIPRLRMVDELRGKLFDL